MGRVRQNTVQNPIDRLHLRLSSHDRAWFEGGWHDFDGQESLYNEALEPAKTLEEGARWGGMMLPDTLPLLANGLGDYLCARFTSEGTLSEIIEWHHEGGNWKHYGYSITEAILFDRLEYVASNDIDSASSMYSSAEISPVAMMEMACKQALRSPLQRACSIKGGGKLAELANVSWDLFRTWLTDSLQMPEDKCARLAAALSMNPEEMIRQDWDTAQAEAQAVLKVRPDLAWPYAVVGRALERHGQLVPAIDVYKAGAMALGSSSSFTSTWMLTPHRETGKFVVDRLALFSEFDFEQDVREYVAAVLERKTRAFWLHRAKNATDRGDHAAAYQHLYAAGWDFLILNDIAEVLKALKTAAEGAGSPALAALAALRLSNAS